jgi:competence protein ComEC
MAVLLILSLALSLLEEPPLDLNAAEGWQLERLPGIGEHRAGSIIEYRERFGPFLELDDLLDVPGIGPSTLEGIEDLVTLSEADSGSALSDTLHWLHHAEIADTMLTVAFIDVGQGDATLLSARGGETWLIDGGPDDGGPITPAILARLWQMGIDSIDVVALSHPHADHIGGLVEVIESLHVTRMLDPGLDFYSPVYELLLISAYESGLEYALLDSGDVFQLSDSVRLEVISMRAREGSTEIDANELSAAMLVSCGSFSLFLAGDIGTPAEMHIFGDTRSVNVLKVPHHGSVSSVFEPFMRRLRPQLAVISVGRNNPFGHPHPTTLELLQELGATVLRTDSAGTIFVRTDGRAIQLTASAR